MRKIEALRYVTQLECRFCGRTLPVSCFERFPTGTYRHVCRQCQRVLYTKPAKQRYRQRKKMERLMQGILR